MRSDWFPYMAAVAITLAIAALSLAIHVDWLISVVRIISDVSDPLPSQQIRERPHREWRPITLIRSDMCVYRLGLAETTFPL